MLFLNPMTLTAATILLYLVALFLTVATLWPFSYPKKTDPQFFWVLIVTVVPFVMLLYFGSAFLISDTISEPDRLKAMRSELGSDWATPSRLSFTESLVAAVTYVGLSGWLWLRWRNPIALSTRILGPTIIATMIAFIIVGVIWTAYNDQIF
jgi:hypothetical protein